jgi:hypothetical protein
MHLDTEGRVSKCCEWQIGNMRVESCANRIGGGRHAYRICNV